MIASIPYFTLPSIDLGPVKLQPFGILVATGVLVGAWIGRKRAEYLGLSDDKVRSMTGWLLVMGFLGAHVFDVLFYQVDKLKEDPLLLVKVWEGISSYGGFIGGVAGFFMFCWRHEIKDKIGYADVTMWGLLPGFTFGRMGCTIVHDHPGRMSEFFLAVDYPAKVASKRKELWESGGAGLRHDLGLYELLFLLVLIVVLVFVVRAWRRRRTGFILGFSAVAYGPVRFFLDDLRLPGPDPRYLGLTFAQYVSFALFLVGVAILRALYRPVRATSSRDRASAGEPEKEPASADKEAGGGGKGAGGGAKRAASGAAKRKKRKGKKKRKK